MGDLPASLAAARQRALNGGQRPRPRPLQRTPQQPYRSAFWDAPETQLPYRAPEQALADRNTLPYVRQETLPQRQVRSDMAQLADRSAAGGSTGYAERNQVREFGNSLMEATGAPSWARGIEDIQYGQPGRAIPEFLNGALATSSLATLPYGAGASAPIRGFQRPPMRAPQTELPRLPPTRIYRGLKDEYDPARAALLGDRWWHTNPNVASTYAPGEGGAHVIPGMVDESALNLARIEAEPGTNSRHIPVTALPANIRRALPRGATYANTHEVAAAAESAGYDGITFSGIRDSGYANAMEGAYPGFETGDDGRVFALFNDRVVQSPFAQQPIRQSMVGGSNDLAEAAGMRPQQAPDGGASGAGNFSWTGENFILDSGGGQIRGRLWANGTTGEQALKIDSSATQAPGTGQGVPLYVQAVQEAQRRGLPLVSDQRVSVSASHVYDALARRGYRVERNPTAEQVRNNWVSRDGDPVFRVTDAPNASSAPPRTTEALDAGRIQLSDLQHQDPLTATFPWEQRYTPTEDMVRDALTRGATRGPASDREVASWRAREHAERIATLMREGWDDPITLRNVEGRLAVDDGYHRLAAARLRGDTSIRARPRTPPRPRPPRRQQ